MTTTLTLTSSAFKNGERIPEKYTCDLSVDRQAGMRDISPPLAITGVPEGAESLVLIMDDPDIPQVIQKSHGLAVFDHWMLYNIPANATEIPEGASLLEDFGMKGLNSVGDTRYIGPCPPPQYEPREHRYVFSLYALKGELHFTDAPTAERVRAKLAPLLLAKTELVGRYSCKP